MNKSEKNIAYQKEYYKKNRDKLIAYNCEKVKCELCDREVCKNRIKLHYKTALCKRTQEEKKMIEERKKTETD